jgi:phosphatidylglycerol---prolipoprotein diacylglyceryl transferase
VAVPLVASITIDIDPILFHLGPFTVRWYGVIMAIAVLVGTWVFSRQLRKRGIAADHALGMLILAVPLGIIGARLFHILDNFGFYRHHPGQLWTLQLIGLAIYGVLTGGVLAVFIYCRRKKLPFLRVLDALALAIPVGQLIGKCANIVNGDTWGYATRLPWGFVYRNPNALLPANLLGVPTQPTPVYEQLWLLVVIGILLWAMPRLKTDGMAFLLYLGLYSLGRFFISFERVNNVLFLHLREAQLVALGVLVAVVPVALLLRRRQAMQPATAGAGGHVRPARRG